MTKSKLFSTLLVVLNVATAIVFIALMPNDVPMALDSNDVLQRMGSRFENVVWPLVACGAYAASRFVMRGEEGEDAESTAKSCLLLQFLLFVAALVVYAFLLSYNPAKNTAYVVVSPSSIALFATGGALVLSMNVVPAVLLGLVPSIGKPQTAEGDERKKRVLKRLGLATIFFGWAFVACGLLADGDIVQIALYASMVLWAALLVASIVAMASSRDDW